MNTSIASAASAQGLLTCSGAVKAQAAAGTGANALRPVSLPDASDIRVGEVFLNPQQVVVEFYIALERATGEGNIHKARTAARAIGCNFTNAESSRWLKPFIEKARARRQSAPVAAPLRHLNGTGFENESAPLLGTGNGLTRGNCIPGLIPEAGSLRSPACAPEPHKAPVVPRVPTLPFDRDLLDRRRAILKAVWQCVQPIIGRAMTAGEWSKRNARVAGDLARLEWTPEKVEIAWEIACRERGEPVRYLSVVQGFLTRVEAYKAQKQAALA